jgi:hypothetical protein
MAGEKTPRSGKITAKRRENDEKNVKLEKKQTDKELALDH